MPQVLGHNMLNNQEKIIEVINRLNSLKIHVDFLEKDIKFNPEWNEPEKPSRENVLQDIKNCINVLQVELDKLTE